MPGPLDNSSERDLLAEAREYLEEALPGLADALAEEVLKRHRSSGEALEIRAAAAFQMARHEAARTFLQRCITLRPKEPRHYARLAEVLAAEGRYDDALRQLERMRRACSGARVPEALEAMLHRLSGDPATARSTIEAARRAGRHSPRADAELAALDLADGDVESAERHGVAAAESGDEGTARRAWFTVGSARERRGDFSGAMEAWSLANHCAARPFDLRPFDERLARIAAVYDEDDLPALRRSSDRSERPVFIAGLPRSGTSLVEQMLACHPEIAGGGELPDLTRLSRELASSETVRFPEAAAHLDEGAATRLGRAYLDRLRRIGRRARFVTNKNLDQHELLGFAWQIVPGSRVIRVRRDPRDVALSCFASDLQPGSHAWASDLQDIAHAFQGHRRMMEHWARVLDLAVIDVAYEDIVREPEREMRRLLSFLDLPYDGACVRHHESRRVAATLSLEQVRRPLYDSSIGRAKPFSRWLDDLGLDASGATGA